jgi:hypothetical protein
VTATGIPSGGWPLAWYTLTHMPYPWLWWTGLVLGVAGVAFSVPGIVRAFRRLPS